ncbi:phosphatidate cytidylyltransferase [candidate division KSB1 bacterium]|nr:phosphatidate cytidylyltransferase [candidate division KSB1 bacterium]
MDVNNFLIRVAVAVIGIPLIFFVIHYGNPYFLLLITLIQVLSLHEFYLLAQKKGFHPSRLLGVCGLFLINSCIHFSEIYFLAASIPFIIVLILIFELFKGSPNAMANAGVTLLGVGYISLLSFLILIRDLSDQASAPSSTSALIVMLVFALIWICDTAAYLFGSYFGKHTLFKRISPNKTWEGTIAGFGFSIIFSALFSFLVVKQLPILSAIIIGAIVGVLGQISDLVESLFKRDAVQKDSSHMLPGHGGILDRFDSSILIAPAVYAYLYYFTFHV